MYYLLIWAEIIRVVLCLIIIFILPIPLWIKVISCMLIDRLDCTSDMFPYKGPLFINDTSICKTVEYSKADKIGDTFTNLFLLIYVYIYAPQYFTLLLLLFVFRLIGVLMFFKTHNKKYFIYFPNFFITFMIFIGIIIDYKLNLSEHIIISGITLLVIYQIIQEYIMHWSPKHNILLD